MINTNRAFGDNKVTYLTYCPFKVLYLLSRYLSELLVHKFSELTFFVTRLLAE